MTTSHLLPCGCPQHAHEDRDAGAYRLRRSLTLPRCSQGRHHHPETRIILSLAGRFETSHGRQRLQVDGDGAVYRPAGDEHLDSYHEPVESLALLLPADAPAGEPYLLRDPALAGLARSLKAEWQMQDKASGLVLEGLVTLAASIVLHRRPVLSRGKPHWIGQVRQQLDASYGVTPTLAALARSVDREAAYVAATFKRVYGSSVGAYLRELRLWQARERMARDEASLADIALDCGYADQSHFTRQFRRRFCITPAEYRRRHSLHLPVPAAA